MKCLQTKLRKCMVLATIAGGLSCAIIVGRAPSVFANGSEYPYADMPCVWAPFVASGTRAQWCSDYDWGEIPGSTAAASVISPYGYYYRNCTDYAAWKVSTLGVAPAQYAGLGNAKDWAARAPEHGLRVDGTPAAGSVAVRVSGTYGHTAFVEEVNPAGFAAGTIKISQYNYYADGNYTERYGTPTSFGFVAFVHFEDYQEAGEPAPVAAPPPEVVSVEAPAAPGLSAAAQPMPAEIDPVLPAEPAELLINTYSGMPPADKDAAAGTSGPEASSEIASPVAEVNQPVAAAAVYEEPPPQVNQVSIGATAPPRIGEAATSPPPLIAMAIPGPAAGQPAPAPAPALTPAESPSPLAMQPERPVTLLAAPASRGSPPAQAWPLGVAVILLFGEVPYRQPPYPVRFRRIRNTGVLVARRRRITLYCTHGKNAYSSGAKI